MKKTMLIGLLLIILGVLSLGYEGITYMTQEEVLDLGPLDVDVQKEETIPVPRILGIAFLVGGVLVMAYPAISSSSK